MIVDLDAPAGRDPITVGAKAAALAAARALGAPVLPGLVVSGTASRNHMELGAKTLPQRGSGGARLVVSGEPIDFAAALVTAGERVSGHLVARSSTLLETSGEWSGAFTSYIDIAPAELPKAVVGCWASAFSVAALERQEAAGITPGSFPMSVLVQPALQPGAGGWAERAADGEVTVHGVKGSPAPLLQGWETGVSGDELIELVGRRNFEQIRDHLKALDAEMGYNRCEWALTDRVWVLQVARMEPASKTPRFAPSFDSDLAGELVETVRTVVLAPGPLGEEMVLPWALSGLPDIDLDRNGAGSATVERARDLCLELTEEVWGLPWTQARKAAGQAMSRLLTVDPGVVSDLRGLRPPDPAKASRLLEILRELREGLVDAGIVAGERDAWHLHPNSIEDALVGRPVGTPTRLGIGRWEPLVASVTLAGPSRHEGTPASPGLGAGLRANVADPHQKRSDRRAVVSSSRPVPNLASLLWDASGLVTASGSPAAHLFEAARALRVPAVCGVDLGEPRREIVAVDGSSGVVARLDLNQEL